MNGFSPAAVRAWVVTSGLVVAPFVVFYLLPFDRWLVPALLGPAVAAAMLPVTIHNSRRILVSRQPLLDAARTLVLLLGWLIIAFATTYYAVEVHTPGEVSGLETKTDAIYFTVTVLATVGFGDIYPAGQTARALAIVQMITNILLLAVSVRLVSWAVSQRADGSRLARGRRGTPPSGGEGGGTTDGPADGRGVNAPS